MSQIHNMPKKTLAIDSDMIDVALDDLNKLILRLDKNPKKTRKEKNKFNYSIRYPFKLSLRASNKSS